MRVGFVLACAVSTCPQTATHALITGLEEYVTESFVSIPFPASFSDCGQGGCCSSFCFFPDSQSVWFLIWGSLCVIFLSLWCKFSQVWTYRTNLEFLQSNLIALLLM